MSSLDRAFFRAYAKEQPAASAGVAPTAPTDEATPYVYFQSSRKPQLRYRIEPTHAPWGAVAPHVDAATIEAPFDEADHRQAAQLDETTPAAWSQEGAATLAPPTQSPAAMAPSAADIAAHSVARQQHHTSTRTEAHDPFADGIVCLPGMGVPESNYLAALVPEEQASSDVVDVATVSPATIIEPEPVVAVELTSSEPTDAAEQTDSEPVAEAAVSEPAVEIPVDPTKLLADESVAFWEVDRYFYPPVSDRLLSRYEYFTCAGDKLKQAAQAGLKVLGITGVGREEGRSTLAICLARAAARTGLKVVLIDCDFQHPQLAQLIGLDVAAGWESVALGEVALAEVAIRSLEDGILLLPLLDEAKTSSLNLSDDRVARILAQVRQTHDVVILDAGPLDGASPHAASLDAAIVVWDRRRRKLDEAQAVAQSLMAAGVEAVGIAENFAG
jgi:Mrp family chromosome partitioning ATPase